MFRKILMICALILIGGAFNANAQFYDIDGQLDLTWTAPNPATNPPLKDFIITYYTFDYAISVQDTTQVITIAVSDGSINLTSQGSWCFAALQARDYQDRESIFTYSDTAFYDEGTGIDPPTGPTWTQ